MKKTLNLSSITKTLNYNYNSYEILKKNPLDDNDSTSMSLNSWNKIKKEMVSVQ